MRRVNLWFEAVLRYLEIRPPRRYRMGQLRLSLRTSAPSRCFSSWLRLPFLPPLRFFSLTLSFPYSALYDRISFLLPYNFKRSSLFLTLPLLRQLLEIGSPIFLFSLSSSLSSPVSLHFRSIPWVEGTYKFMIPLLAFFFLAISRSPFLLGARSFASLFYSSSLFLYMYIYIYLSFSLPLARCSSLFVRHLY